MADEDARRIYSKGLSDDKALSRRNSVRLAPLAMDAVTFLELDHRLVDQLASPRLAYRGMIGDDIHLMPKSLARLPAVKEFRSSL
jgi:hypothetical protein